MADNADAPCVFLCVFSRVNDAYTCTRTPPAEKKRAAALQCLNSLYVQYASALLVTPSSSLRTVWVVCVWRSTNKGRWRLGALGLARRVPRQSAIVFILFLFSRHSLSCSCSLVTSLCCSFSLVTCTHTFSFLVPYASSMYWLLPCRGSRTPCGRTLSTPSRSVRWRGSWCAWSRETTSPRLR